MSHTPGPWRVLPDEGKGYFRIRGLGRRYRIANVLNPNLSEQSQSAANARLIAAAPDLLEALKEAVAYPLTGDWFGRATTALARAEGRGGRL